MEAKILPDLADTGRGRREEDGQRHDSVLVEGVAHPTEQALLRGLDPAVR